MTIRGLLFSELERLAANCRRLLALPRAEHLDWRPAANMRSLAELANHLAQIPAVDLQILKGAPEEQIGTLEQELLRSEPAAWVEVMGQGLTDLLRYMEKLSVDNFEHDSATAYYGRTQTHAQWLFEILGHLYHHRAQLFNYLKQLGYPVNTRTLYG
jgi:uncharacterized damage-inducible protein DinB